MTIESCKSLFLTSLTEPDEGGLQLVVREGQACKSPEEIAKAKALQPDLSSILEKAILIRHGPGCRVFTLRWPGYISYAVENESYSRNCTTDERTGKLFRLYSKSAYLDYLAKVTFASDVYPGPFKHWAVVCEDHVVNIASCDEPVIAIQTI